MSPDQLAIANSRLFALMAHLVLDGISAENRPLILLIPPLEPFVPRSNHPDDWAVEHQRFFGQELLPWASVFRNADRQLAGTVAESVARCYADAGFRPPESHEPDHLGVELMFLAWLWDRRDIDGAAAFAAEHLLPWLMPLSCAGRDAGGFYADVVQFSLQLSESFADPPTLDDIAVPAVLDDPKSGLKHVARWLATPAWSGFFWTHRALSWVAGRGGVAHGFGSREKILESTLFSASDAGKLTELTEAMESRIATWRDRMDGPAAEPWLRRLDGTSAVLRRLGAAGE